jgi:PKHD-type hydroxylase
MATDPKRPFATGGHYANYAAVPDVFTGADLDRVLEFGSRQLLSAGKIHLGEADNKLRRSRIAPLPDQQESAWLYDRLMRVIADVNRQLWKFDLESLQPIQYAEYGEGEFYNWHMDLGENASTQRRKISITAQLDDPSTYEGGDLEFWAGSVRQAARDRGSVIVFPSYLLHRVTPVTRGLRRSLAAWALGKKPFV